MSADRPTPIDDHGDQFTRMHAAYVHKVNSLVEADRHGLAYELAEAFAAEFPGAAAQHDRTRLTSGGGTRTRKAGSRPPGQGGTRLGRFTRTSLR